MTLPKTIKTCFIVSYGPVPTPQYQTIEGGGMRAWGLAEGLKRNGIEVTVGINNSFPQELTAHQGIKLTNWGLDQAFADLLNSYDAVIVSYCMGNDSVFVAEKINNSVQLILDAYVPIYVEVSARESNNIDFEYKHYMDDIKRFNRVLLRGDYFLCANEAQKTFYIGVLASLGIINPRSYRDNRIIVAPFGIHDLPAVANDNPFVSQLKFDESDFAVMWFGGIYPWFRIEELLGAILKLSKDPRVRFVIVGGKNPFNPNPDFSRQYDKTLAFAQKHNLLNKSLFFVDWVDFKTRINWFKNANVVISLNQPGEENGFSWRTRVMDFVWGELTILTNGGDPLSEDLLTAGAAIRLNKLSADDIALTIQKLHKDKELSLSIKKNLVQLKPNYYWQNITKPIHQVITDGTLPYNDEKAFRHRIHVASPSSILEAPLEPTGKIHKIKRIYRLPGRVVSYARRKGLKRSLKLAAGIARTQISNRLTPRPRRFVFIGHPMDNTGAPVVLVQVIHEFAEKYGAKNIRLVAPFIESNLLRNLREMGVRVEKAALGLGNRLVDAQLQLQKNDFVLMNTIAIYDNYRDYILRRLENGSLTHAYWFIHEDKAQIPVINNEFLNKGTLSRIRRLADSKKLSLVVPSHRTKEDYTKIIGTQNIKSIPLLVDVPKKYCNPRPAKDFKSIHFFLSGNAADGRKGQLIAISALNEFLHSYYYKNPKKYRDFSLTLLSIGHDYISQQIRWIGESLLGKRIALHPSVPRPEALEIAASCNAVLCCSLNETFGLYVAECMSMGHIVLRNDSAGMDEQLKKGVNGYFIDHKDIPSMAKVFEKLLNKETTSDQKLQAMGMASQKIISDYGQHDYLQKIEEL